jgi:hypothetical protein
MKGQPGIAGRPHGQLIESRFVWGGRWDLRFRGDAKVVVVDNWPSFWARSATAGGARQWVMEDLRMGLNIRSGNLWKWSLRRWLDRSGVSADALAEEGLSVFQMFVPESRNPGVVGPQQRHQKTNLR